MVTGSNNTSIGASADASADNATNPIVIGHAAIGLGDNYAVVGNTDVTRLYVAQDGEGVLYANGTIQTSDRRVKKHITDLAVGLDYVRRLRPVTYVKKHPASIRKRCKTSSTPRAICARSTPPTTTARRWASLPKRSRR